MKVIDVLMHYNKSNRGETVHNLLLHSYYTHDIYLSGAADVEGA